MNCFFLYLINIYESFRGLYGLMFMLYSFLYLVVFFCFFSLNKSSGY